MVVVVAVAASLDLFGKDLHEDTLVCRRASYTLKCHTLISGTKQ